jgi:hypothetical protein
MIVEPISGNTITNYMYRKVTAGTDAGQRPQAQDQKPELLLSSARQEDSTNMNDLIKPVIAAVQGFRKQIDLLQIDFPPFLPLGSTVRMFVIDHVNETLEKIGKYLGSEQQPTTGQSELPSLSPDASDEEIVTMTENLFGLQKDLETHFLKQADTGSAGTKAASAGPVLASVKV